MTTTLAGATRRIDVHFEDLDPVGVVHNARYPVLLERAISLFWHDHGMPTPWTEQGRDIAATLLK